MLLKSGYKVISKETILDLFSNINNNNLEIVYFQKKTIGILYMESFLRMMKEEVYLFLPYMVILEIQRIN